MPNKYQAITIEVSNETTFRLLLGYEVRDKTKLKPNKHLLTTHWQFQNTAFQNQSISLESVFKTISEKFISLCSIIQSNDCRWQSLKLEVLVNNKRIAVYHKRLIGFIGQNDAIPESSKCFKFEVRSLIDAEPGKEAKIITESDVTKASNVLHCYRTISLYGVPQIYENSTLDVSSPEYLKVEQIANAFLNPIPLSLEKAVEIPSLSKDPKNLQLAKASNSESKSSNLSLCMVYPTRIGNQEIYHSAISVEALGLRPIKTKA